MSRDYHIPVLLYFLLLAEGFWIAYTENAVALTTVPTRESTEISLAIVFDTTGSMGNDLRQVKMGIKRIIKKLEEKGMSNIIKDYIVVPVHDPDVGPAQKTTSSKKFRQMLGNMYTQGGGDCPEMTIRGIQMALEEARPNSLIYVFTDSSAKDFHLKPKVLDLIQKKQGQVTFVLTGYCNSTDEPGFLAYQEIATISSGQVYIIDKGQVNDVMKLIESVVDGLRVHILQEDTNRPGPKTYTFPVDSHLRQITVKVSNYQSNDSITVTIRDPKGKKITEKEGLIQLMKNVTSVFIGSLKNPEKGSWTLEVSTNNKRHSVRVAGKSNVDFLQGFATSQILDNYGTSLRPLKGVKNFMMSNITGNYLPGTINMFSIVAVNGTSLVRMEVNQTPNSQVYYSRYSFDANIDGHYYLKISGIDDQGYAMQRYSKIAISAREPRKTSVTCPAMIEVRRGASAKINCAVDSEIPFMVIWQHNSKKLRGFPDENKHYMTSSNVTYTMNNADENSQGIYSVELKPFDKNDQLFKGITKDEVALKVLPPPPRVFVPRNSSIEPKQDASLECKVFSQSSEVSVRWFRVVPRFQLKNSRRYRIELVNNTRVAKTSTLRVLLATESDQGEYMCVAEHKGGSTSSSGFIKIQLPPKVNVDSKKKSFEDGGTIELVCRGEGNPNPVLSWSLNEIPISSIGRFEIQSGFLESRLIVRNAKQEDEGSYKCIATNPAGSDSIIIQAEFISKPDIEEIIKSRDIPVEGQPEKLICRVGGIPRPMVKWEFNGSPVSENINIRLNETSGELTISRVTRQMKGKWTCVASNSAGTSRDSIVLDVGYPPKLLDFKRDVQINFGANSTLKCNMEGQPPPRVKWYRGSSPNQLVPITYGDRYYLTKQNSLRMQSVALEDKGFYTCKGDNAHGKAEGTLVLSIGGTQAPVISFTQPKEVAVEGQNQKILNCIVLNAKPPATVIWMKNNREIVPSISQGSESSQLVLRDIKVEDEGVYTCVAKNIVGKAEFNIHLDVQTKPVITGNKKEYIDVIQGDKVILLCEAKGDPTPRVEWRKDGKPLVSEAGSSYLFSRDGTKLTVYSVSGQNAGTITCTASNAHSADIKQFILTVKTLPVISKDGLSEFEIGKSESALLSCIVTDGEPDPKTKWFKDGRPLRAIPGRIDIIDSNTVEVFGKHQDESGSFECRAENSAGSDSRFYQITVLVAPTPSTTDVIKHYTREGDQVILPCEIEGYPMPDKTWFFKGNTLDLERNELGLRPASDDKTTIYIPTMTKELQGLYTCEGKNRGGDAKLRHEVIILQKAVITKIPKSAVIFIKNTITLTCLATGSPKPNITWLFQKKPIAEGTPGYRFMDDGIMIVYNAEFKHGGKYTCRAENEAGMDEKDTTVTVFVPGTDGNGSGGGKIAYNKTDEAVLRGGNITFTCVMNSTPPADIRWFKDDIMLHLAMSADRFFINEDGSTLTIYNVRENDKGKFKCLAINIPGNITQRFTLTVQISPWINRRLSSPKELEMLSDSDLQLHCRAEASPDPTYSWWKGDSQLMPSTRLEFQDQGRTLFLRGIQRDDAGVFECRATNAAGLDSATFVVNLMEQPVIAGLERETPSLERNKAASLFCNITAGIPVPTITWETEHMGSIPAGVRLLNNDTQLYIPNVDKNFIKRYICTAQNTVGLATKVFDPILVYKPEITNQKDNTERWVLVSGEMRLSCDVTGVPNPTIEWFKDGDKITFGMFPRVNISSSNTQLHLFKAKEKDAGSYKCVATNKYGTTKKQWSVQIMVPPVITISSPEGAKEVSLDTGLTLFCVGEGKPKPKIEWLKDGSSIDLSRVTLSKDGVQINVPKAKEVDAGLYTCRASSEYGQDSKTYSVKVTFGPRLDREGLRYYKIDKTVGSSAMIYCLVSGSPPPTIVWTKDNKVLPSPLPFRLRLSNQRRQLEILQMRTEDAGKYVCRANNSLGDLDVVTDVNVGAPARINRQRMHFEYIVVVGEDLQLPCPASGSPEPTITYSKEKVPIDDNQNNFGSRGGIVSQDRKLLTLFRVRKEDSGTYECNASNSNGWDVVEYLVRVKVPPSIETSNYQKTARWFVNQTRFLECTLKKISDPPAKVTWERRGAPLVESSNIRISGDGTKMTVLNVQQYDSGEYRCVASNEVGKVTLTYEVVVLVKPRFLDSTSYQRVEAIQNSTVRLSCQSIGTPQPTVIWYRNSREIDPDQQSFPNFAITRGNQVLQITNIQTYDQAEYSCIVANGGGSIEKKFNISIIIPPRIMKRSMFPEEHTTFENMAITLQCIVYDRNQTRAVITWTKDNMPILVEDTEFYLVSHQGQKLSILRPSPLEAGKYKCRVENKAGFDTNSYELKIIAPPRFPNTFSRYREKITVQVGNPITLKCPASGTPTPTITWYFNNAPLERYLRPSIVSGEGQTVLQIPSVQKDAGEYRCVARNDGGNVSKIYDLEVIMPPLVRLDKTDVKEREGTTFTIQCSAKGFPEPTIKWTRDGLGLFRLGTSADPVTGVLTITDARAEDTGRYTCTASNSVSQDSKSVDIQIMERPNLQVPSKSIQAKVGDQIMLPCKVTGTPPILVSWIVPNGNQVSQSLLGDYRVLPEQGMVIERVKKSNAGRYRCSASNMAGYKDAYVTLEVLVPPRLERSINTTKVGLLQSVLQIQCKVVEGMPSPIVHWERNGVVFSRFKNYYTTTDSGLFIFNSLNKEDEGDLTCVARNAAGTDRQTFKIVVELLPKVSLPVSTLGYEGQSVTIRCEVEGRPKPEIKWEMNGKPLLAALGNRIRQNGPEEFTIYDIKPTDSGNYICIGRRQGAETVRASTYLTVFTRPVFVETPKANMDAYESRWIRFACRADGNPKPRITFLRNGRVLTSNGGNNGFGSLVLGNIRPDQSGEYTCEAKNDVSKELFTFQLNVITRPRVMVYQSDEPVSERHTTTLTCDVKGDADLIIWLKDGQVVKNSSRISIQHNTTLVITDTKVTDTGTYQCIATNPVGEAQGQVKLLIRSQPRFIQEPSNITAEQGDIAVLPCTVSGFPTPLVTWFKDRETLTMDTSRSVIIRNGTLRILGVSGSSSGVYQCSATNELGEIQSKLATVRVVVHGGWGGWTNWTSCSTTCGQGQSTRTRKCNNPSPSNGGLHCSGEAVVTRSCLNSFCPRDGQWSSWTPWTSCSTTCGAGLQQRRRRCDSPPPSNGGKACVGDAMEDVMCEKNQACPRHGSWSSWASWTECSVTCGEGGTQRRTRVCDSPSPINGGRDCPGKTMTVRACSQLGCPLPGAWSPWKAWSICSRSCGTGTKRRIRACNNPPPAFGGDNCSGKKSENQNCNPSPCPINGEWSNWSSWTLCSRTCGPGLRSRERTCTEPDPSHGGRWCPGGSKEIKSCEDAPCPGTSGGLWSPWSSWSQCTATCGLSGQKERRRTCLRGPCEGLGREVGDCGQLPRCQEGSGKPVFSSMGEIRGAINNENIGVVLLNASWTSSGAKKTAFDVNLNNIMKKDVPCFKILSGLLSPLLWLGAYEVAKASNGHTVTGGNFRRDSVVQFADGSTLYLTHHGSPDASQINLRTEVRGRCPAKAANSTITFEKYIEKYVQMNPAISLIHSDSSRYYRQDGRVEPYSWSHNISSSAGNRQRYLVQQLLVDDLLVTGSSEQGYVRFSASAVIAKDDNGDSCPAGFKILKNFNYCQDVNECTSTDMNQCDQLCENLVPLYKCNCRIGFMLGSDGRSCRDVDECARGRHNCGRGQLCTNTAGSFRCVARCSTGLRRKKQGGCEDVNECREKPGLCGEHECVNTRGSYSCNCRPGYQMINGKCVDVDECIESLDKCQPHQRCLNVPSTYRCLDTCDLGYKVTSSGQCIDIDECSSGTSKCPTGSQCINTPGSFSCQCPQGFKEKFGRCSDIDECRLQPSPCSFGCRNTWGSYQCICPSGQKRSSDKKRCIDTTNKCKAGFKWDEQRGCSDINECKPTFGGSPCQYKCENTYGSYRCSCPPGYSFYPTTNKCKDIDECRLDRGLCGHNQLCLNTMGNYTCVDVLCPDKYKFDSVRKTCKVPCADSNLPCPDGSKYADTIQYLIVNMPGQRGATVKVRVVNTLKQMQPNCDYTLLNSTPNSPFAYRSQGGVVLLTYGHRGAGGLVNFQPTVAPPKDNLYYMYFRVTCYQSHQRRTLIFQNSFYIYITLSKYPF